MESATNPTYQADEEKARAILSETPLPPELDRVSIKVKNDSDGTLALYLSFEVKAEAKLERETIERLSRYITSIQLRLVGAGMSLFPYASLDQAA
jgi:hypothetical protein